MMKERGNPLLRFLDRYMGIPLVFLLGLFVRKKPMPSSIDSIALLKTAGIGDLVLLSGIIRDLRTTYPQASLTLYTGRANAEMGKLIEGVATVVLPITSLMQSIKSVRAKQHTLWIDFDPWPKINALLSFFSRSQVRIGFKTRGQHRHFVYNAFCEHKSDCHEIDNYRRLVRPLGISIHHPPTLTHQWKGQKGKKVALHLFPGGSRAALKQWEEDKWEKLILFLVDQGYMCILTGGKKEQSALQQLKSNISSPLVENMAGVLSLKETAQLLCECNCLISVDTGIMHLGAAVGCPTVALHGPTSPKRWGGIGQKVVAVTPPFAYHPCIHLGFEKVCKDNSCMKSISLEQVQKAFKLLMENSL